MNSTKKNIAYNAIYQILILIVPFVTAPYISRVLLPEGVGTYSITTAIAKYFVLFAMLGMANYGNRTIAKVRDSKVQLSNTFWSLIMFQGIVSITVIIIYIIYMIIQGIPKYGLSSLCQLPYIFSSLLEVSWFFYGTEQFRFMVNRNVIIKVLSTLGIFLFVKSPTDVWIYVLISSLSLFLGQLCLWPFLLKEVYFVWPKFEEIISHLKPNLILFVSVVAVSIYTLMDKIMLDFFSDRVQIGYYENTEKVFNLCINFIGAIGAVMLPKISNLIEKDKNKVINYIDKSMRYIMIFSIAISFGMMAISKEFSVLFFGEEYSACGNMIFVISIAVIFYSWENILRTHYILPIGKDEIFVKGTICAAIVNFILNLFLIPFFGGLGAVIGTVSAQVAEAIYQSIRLKKVLKIKEYIKSLIPFFCVGLLMYILCRFIASIITNTLLNVIIQICIGAVFYLFLAFVILLCKKDEEIINLIKKLEGKLTK